MGLVSKAVSESQKTRAVSECAINDGPLWPTAELCSNRGSFSRGIRRAGSTTRSTSSSRQGTTRNTQVLTFLSERARWQPQLPYSDTRRETGTATCRRCHLSGGCIWSWRSASTRGQPHLGPYPNPPCTTGSRGPPWCLGNWGTARSE
jgi:hypothetical protein